MLPVAQSNPATKNSVESCLLVASCNSPSFDCTIDRVNNTRLNDGQVGQTGFETVSKQAQPENDSIVGCLDPTLKALYCGDGSCLGRGKYRSLRDMILTISNTPI